jgi:uncharacterized membrane protein YcaP (DUF421 family)
MSRHRREPESESAVMLPVIKPLLPVLFHTAVIYTFLILMLRFASPRQLGQFTAIDLVVVILLGSAVETAMVNGNTSLPAGLVCATTLLLLNRLASRLFLRSRRLRHLVSTGPTVLIHDGKFVDEHLRRAGLTHADVLEALRQREESDVSQVRFAVLETDGTINVVPMNATMHRSKHKVIQRPVTLRKDQKDSASPTA